MKICVNLRNLRAKIRIENYRVVCPLFLKKVRNVLVGEGFIPYTPRITMPAPAPHQRPSSSTPLSKDDALWQLLEHGSQQEVASSFVTDTVRAARLSAQPSCQERCRRLFTQPATLVGTSIAVVALCVGIISFSGNTGAAAAPALVDAATPYEDDATLWLQGNLLATAAEQPDLFTEAEIVALIF